MKVTNKEISSVLQEMQVEQNGFSTVLLENDYKYLEFLYTLLQHSDPQVKVSIMKMDEEIHTTISPSQQEFRQHIIDNLLFGHRLLGIKIIFSKSLAISKHISYIVW